jgi:kojibiose phosphorylase
MGNAAGGIHAAAVGGLWQAMVFGFGGLSLRSDGVSFSPRLLPRWRRLAFPIEWRGRRIRVCIEPHQFSVRVDGAAEPMTIALSGEPGVTIHPGRNYTALHSGQGWEGLQEENN